MCGQPLTPKHLKTQISSVFYARIIVDFASSCHKAGRAITQ